MNQLIIIIALLFLFFSSASEMKSEDILKEAQSKVMNSKRISYEQIAYYPNPVGIDTINTTAIFIKNDNSIVNYDFIIKSTLGDFVLIEGDLNSIDHREKTVKRFQADNIEQIKNYVKGADNFKNSPVTLIQLTDWAYIGDTIISDSKYADFSRIERDTVVNGNTIYTEQHLFINTATKLIERWERRNYYKGSLSQTVIYKFGNYNFDDNSMVLSYTNPDNYTSTVYGAKQNIQSLAVGQKAPKFSLTDIDNNVIDLGDYRGKKVLLNFSSIGCSYCHEALKLMNQQDYKLPDNVKAFYLSVFDNPDKLKRYFNKMAISYPVIPNAEEIAKLYGAASTPNFFLINEEGVIEKVIIGFDKEFLLNLQNL